MRLPPMMHVLVLPGEYAVAQLPAGAAPPAPPPAMGPGDVYSITVTPDEVSLVCPSSAVPPDARVDGGWRLLKVAGPLDLELVGILASLLQPLMQADISVFCVATYDTDYVLVKDAQLRQAAIALKVAGHKVEALTA
jgi:hypothetical protein